MGEFRVLSDEEFNALSSKERRDYLKELKHNRSEKLVNDVITSNSENNDAAYKAPSLNNGTSKNIIDIDINLVEPDPINEEQYGYEDEDLDDIKESFNIIGNDSIICVYSTDEGKYLCYSGNQRLITSKNNGEKTITCFVKGPAPDEETRMDYLDLMNIHRPPRPYYLANRIKNYERRLRRKGEKNISGKIEERYKIKAAMQRRYLQIFKLEPSLQELFKKRDIPFDYLIQCCNKIPTDKSERFAELFNEKCIEEGPTVDAINAALKALSENDKSVEVKQIIKKPKTSQVFKGITSLPYFEPGEKIEIPEKKKEEILKQAVLMEDYIKRIKEACS